MNTKKNNFLGFRLSDDILEKLDLIAKQKAKTRGVTAKNAIEQWINHEIINQTNQMIIIPKNLLIKLLSFEINTSEKLESVIKENTDLIGDIMKFILSKPMDEETLEDYVKFSINLFGSEGLNWFNSLDININNDHFILMGLHDLDENFSVFFQMFYKYLLREHFNFEVLSDLEETTNNLIHLEFTLKKK